MLSIAKLRAGQERYYLEQAGARVDVVTSVVGGVEDYYADGPEVPGWWMGSASRRLGATGVVGGDALRNVLAGLTPDGGPALRSAAVKVAAFDLTFSAPKSVSVLFALGEGWVTASVRAAHDRAVEQAFGYLERSAGRVRRGAGGSKVLSAEGLLAAAFRHRTSRLGDPQLHTHVVVANLAAGPDGRWSALDGRPIYAHARAASFIYQAVLRGELTRELGVEWTPVRDGIAEINGIPGRVLRAFSRRRAQIEKAMTDRGVNGPRASEVAALSTRRAKNDLQPEALVEQWHTRASVHGFPAKRVGRVVGRADARELDSESWAEIFEEMAGPDGLTERASSFTKRDVAAALCDRLPPGAGVDAAALEQAASRFLASEHVVALAAGREGLASATVFVRRDGRALPVDPAELRYSTRELLAVERRLVDRALASAHTDRPARAATVKHVLERRPGLAVEQAAMVTALTCGTDRVAVAVGRAGTGKTYALAACHDAWRAERRPVIGTAVARRAARELQDRAAIPSTSIAALIAGLRRGDGLPPRSVLVVDEAGMVGTRQLAQLLDAVESADGKLVLVGDHRQLPSIDAGGVFHHLLRRLPTVELVHNRRQTEVWEREAVELVRDGRGHEALQCYRDHHRLHIAPTADAAREQLAAGWWNEGDPGDAVMIALRRDDVADLNHRAHELMRDAGRLGRDELDLPGGRFAVSDQVLIRRNELRLGIANGDRGTVTAINPVDRSLELDLGRERITLPAGFLDARTDHGNPVLTHGYAITGHAAQGLTVDRAHILADPAISREWAYTALTRGRHANHLYLAEQRDLGRHDYAPADGLPPAPEARLAAALNSPSADRLAVESLPASPAFDEAAQRRVTELVRHRALAAQAVATARNVHRELRARPAPVRFLHRRAIAEAAVTERAAGGRLAHIEHALADARSSLGNNAASDRGGRADVAHLYTRRLERQQERDRTRSREPARDHGIER